MTTFTQLKPELPKDAPSPTPFQPFSWDLLTATLPGPTHTTAAFQKSGYTKGRETIYYNPSKSWNITKLLKRWTLPLSRPALQQEEPDTERGSEECDTGGDVTCHRLLPPPAAPRPCRFNECLEKPPSCRDTNPLWKESRPEPSLIFASAFSQNTHSNSSWEGKKKHTTHTLFKTSSLSNARQKRGEPYTYSSPHSFLVLARQLLNIQDIFKSS